MKITLDYTKSVEQNAAEYYDKSKKAKKKLEGLNEALEMTRRRLEEAQRAHQEAAEQIQQEQTKEKVKREWYEKFRWFHTSGGKLVIGGRDAITNEMIVKRYAEPGDIVFHTDMAGSPFFLVKGGADASEEEKSEVAQATAAYSRAWGKGLSTTDVFWVTPEQVTKEARAGESLGTGAFVIRGKTTYVSVREMSLAMGVKDGRLIGGPVAAVKAQASIFVRIIQGRDKPGQVAKQVRAKLNYSDLDEIIRFSPAGSVALAKK